MVVYSLDNYRRSEIFNNKSSHQKLDPGKKFLQKITHKNFVAAIQPSKFVF